MFEYVCRALIIGCFVVELEKPTGDANNTNTSHVGLVIAADSIAHACL